MQLAPNDERRHTPDSHPLWAESWWFDVVAPDRDLGLLGLVVQLTLHPHRAAAWYWAGLAGDRQPLVTVIDHEVPMPRGGRLEIRTEGLWADHICETAFDHWTIGCEAFAVELDDPAEALGGLRGDRVAFGLDLEWEADGAIESQSGGEASEYHMPCRVHGEVLLGDGRIDLDGHGRRGHRWGRHDWWTGGWERTFARFGDGSTAAGDDGRLEGLLVESVATIPVAVPGPDGQVSELVRTLARLSRANMPASDSDSAAAGGWGWIETNHPRTT